MDKEEGEMSDDHSMDICSDEEQPFIEMDTSLTVLYKSEKNSVVIEKLEKTDAKKLEERAKRFGLDLTGHKAITQTQIDELYNNFNIKNVNERHFRFDTLHLSGVDDLTTREIFEYLEDYKPVSLEWINRASCNVVCQDHIAAALALMAHSREINNEEIKKSVLESSTYHWREGFPHPKKDMILFRFATNSDRKESKVKSEKNIPPKRVYNNQTEVENSNEKNPWGNLCKSWGVYDHQEVLNRPFPHRVDIEDNSEVEEDEVFKIKNKKLAKRLGKRTHRISESEDSSDAEWRQKPKVLRMRMHADDEELREQKNKLSKQTVINDCDKHDDFAPLSIEIINEKTSHISKPTTKLSDKFKTKKTPTNHKDSIQSRLGAKLSQPDEQYSSDDSSVSYSNEISKSQVHKISSAIERKSSNVWSRLDKSRGEGDSRNDLRQKLKSKNNEVNDLRKRIGNSNARKGRSPLRIEIDNDV